MKKVLLIGSCPLPDEKAVSRPAAGLRTYQFWKAITSEGFEVGLVKIAMPECYNEGVEKRILDQELVLSKDNPRLINEIQKFHDRFEPDSIVAVNNFPAYVCSKLSTSVPTWVDLNGWIMAEAQAQAFKKGRNDYLAHYLDIEKSALKMADKTSTVSEKQKFAVLGELAFLGRLNKETFGYEFCEVIKNATQEFDNDRVGGEIELDLPENSFKILWVGGYNTWVDEVALFESLEFVMHRHENIYFVSTGGEIKGLDDKTFANFKSMIEKSELKDRFNFLGWVKSELLPSLYASVNLGLNIDRMCIETLTGARNRINEMMKFGLPVVTTAGSEVALEVDVCGAGKMVASGDFMAVAEAIEKIYSEWNDGNLSEEYKRYGENGKKYTKENDYKKTVSPLLKWLKETRFAPDKEVKIKLENGISVKALWYYLRENGFKKSFKKFLQKIGGQ